MKIIRKYIFERFQENSNDFIDNFFSQGSGLTKCTDVDGTMR